MATSSFFGPLKITKDQEAVWKEVFSDSHKMIWDKDIRKKIPLLNHEEAQAVKKFIKRG
ncbi:MAG: hypothetical protein MSN80_04675 [Veillonella caviae]|uniref:hypothetical protein n=1 Tax=Veillonella caviae TaxID=248316 RepID=UPI0023F63407|nr:hypothetical protein [Veillonella caviae]MCI7693785.1 hypothetical protein [Veillonella caviae]